MFAGTVMLGDLNDFISPATACVNPIVATRSAGAGSGGPAIAQLGVALGYEDEPLLAASQASTKPNLIKKDGGNAAKVSLNDCLACSGCVTSAETVLITQQSSVEVLRALQDRGRYKLRVISISPQAIASLAVQFGVSDPAVCFARLAAFLKRQLGFDAVIGTLVGAELSLLESGREFVARARHAGIGAPSAAATAAAGSSVADAGSAAAAAPSSAAARRKQMLAARAGGGAAADVGSTTTPAGPAAGAAGSSPLPWAAPTPTVALSALQSRVVLPGSNAWDESAPVSENAAFDTSCGLWAGAHADAHGAGSSSSSAAAPASGSSSSSSSGSSSASERPLPLLTSSCPGWVCYAEKTVPESLRYVATAKSPQQMTGTLVKTLLSRAGLVPGASGATAAGASAASGAAAGAVMAVDAGDAAADGSGSAALVPAADGMTEAVVDLPSHIYHVTVMPCYDRKLEASRRDFAWPVPEAALAAGGDAAASSTGSAAGDAASAAGAAGSAAAAGPVLVPEVDCVLTSSEVAELLEEHGCTLADDSILTSASPADAAAGGVALADAALLRACSALEQLLPGLLPVEQPADAALITSAAAASVSPALALALCASEQASSDAYADFVLRYAAAELWGLRAEPAAPVPAGDAGTTVVPSASGAGAGTGVATYRFTAGRNADFREALLDAGHGRKLRFALAYGFRNIQAIVQRLRRGRCEFDFVEVMACPSGCANGGGQIRPPAPAPPLSGIGIPGAAAAAAVAGLTSRDPAKNRAAAVQAMMAPSPDGRRAVASGLANRASRLAAAAYRALQQRTAHDAACQLLLHTQYHNVPPLETGLTAKW